jgi:hypothetical protein
MTVKLVKLAAGAFWAVSLTGCGQERLSYRIPQEQANPVKISQISREFSAIAGVDKIEIQDTGSGKEIQLTCDSDSTSIVSQKAAHFGLTSSSTTPQ